MPAAAGVLVTVALTDITGALHRDTASDASERDR